MHIPLHIHTHACLIAAFPLFKQRLSGCAARGARNPQDLVAIWLASSYTCVLVSLLHFFLQAGGGFPSCAAHGATSPHLRLQRSGGLECVQRLLASSQGYCRPMPWMMGGTVAFWRLNLERSATSLSIGLSKSLKSSAPATPPRSSYSFQLQTGGGADSALARIF